MEYGPCNSPWMKPTKPSRQLLVFSFTGKYPWCLYERVVSSYTNSFPPSFKHDILFAGNEKEFIRIPIGSFVCEKTETDLLNSPPPLPPSRRVQRTWEASTELRK